ncbi:DUF222 domain-containing protein, partial [Mycolicibacterium sp. BiH015]|uniref:DUF222 domain-containing protein n=1 Tax=Mycolicibacterium sp. BiH015 TaxID=3018808 RepID=UPI0022E4F83B
MEAVWAKEAAPGHHLPDDELNDPADTTAPSGTPEGDAAVDDHDPQPEARGSDPRTQQQRNHDALEALAVEALRSGDLGTHHG